MTPWLFSGTHSLQCVMCESAVAYPGGNFLVPQLCFLWKWCHPVWLVHLSHWKIQQWMLVVSVWCQAILVRLSVSVAACPCPSLSHFWYQLVSLVMPAHPVAYLFVHTLSPSYRKVVDNRSRSSQVDYTILEWLYYRFRTNFQNSSLLSLFYIVLSNV